jgi:hypothetical protein
LRAPTVTDTHPSRRRKARRAREGERERERERDSVYIRVCMYVSNSCIHKYGYV